MYKPSFVMEWRASPVQGKTLCKVIVGARGTPVFPVETRANINVTHSEICKSRFLIYVA